MGKIKDYLIKLLRRLFCVGTTEPAGLPRCASPQAADPRNRAPIPPVISPASASPPLMLLPVNTPDDITHSPSTVPKSVKSSIDQPIWSGLRAFAAALTEAGTPLGALKSTIGLFLGLVDNIEQVAASEEEYRSLRASIDGLFGDLAVQFSEDSPPEMRPSIINLASGLKREMDYIQAKHTGPTCWNLSAAQDDLEDLLGCYRRIQGHLERLTMNANFNIWMLVDRLAMNARLKNLDHAAAAWYSSEESKHIYRDECTPDTRLEVLERFRLWKDSDDINRVYWLTGMAGTGKTTLAYTICNNLEGEHRLAANFFCSRSLPTCREARRIIPTIAYQLASFSYPFCCALSRTLEQNQDVHTRRVQEQFAKLVIEPLREARRMMPENLIVVIDGLDECSNQAAIGELLDLIFDHTVDLPFKLLLTSRPEPVIRARMISRKSGKERSEVHLHDLNRATVQADIRKYLRDGLKGLNVSADDLEVLIEQSGLLFIYAATVVRFVGERNFERGASRLKMILRTSGSSNGSEAVLNNLYTLILDQSVDKLIEQEKAEAVLILHSAVFAKGPITAPILAGFLGLHLTDSVDPTLNSFRSVLNVKQDNEGITILHKSFADFLLDPRRSGPFYYCNHSEHHFKCAQRCLAWINQSKPFNICNLASSFVFDKDVPNIHELVQEHISEQLLYSCRYWTSHLDSTTRATDLLSDIETFLASRVLLWMEVMNLTKHLGYTGPHALLWLKEWTLLPENLREPIKDAYEFHLEFDTSSATRSTPHIYVSALQFWPKEQYISQQYRRYNRDIMTHASNHLEGSHVVVPLVISAIGAVFSCIASSRDGTYICTAAGATLQIWDMDTKKPVMQPMAGHTGAVYSVAYSTKGAHVCSGSADQTVRVWNTQTSQQVGQPLMGHTGAVYCVTYSPNDAHICSGSADHTIRVWDFCTSQQVGKLLVGHTGAVYSVTYSPDCGHICSGSADRTVRVWDAYTGRQIGKPITGHTGAVYSVAYSPGGTRVCSGSADQTVRVWDIYPSQQAGQSLVGHTQTVCSVTCSPDTTRICSGSIDQTVRVWDSHTGQQLGPPLRGHTGTVHSVAYSSDGIHVCSGSADQTVRVWNIYEGQQVVKPFAGHAGAIYSVAYSPSSTRICSGSEDRTIRVWDAHAGQQVGQPILGHVGTVYSVAYSPDDTQICSGSADQTVRIWNLNTGQQIGQSLAGHAGAVYSVAYSPNGVHICSGSADQTVRVWNTQTGQQVGQSLLGHIRAVYSIAYSPDGAHICSGSADQTIRVWNPHTGRQIGQSFVGHAGTVYSVAYSPDGALICSGSADQTVRAWYVYKNQQVGQPMAGHTGAVYSVAYSPDATHICSGSADRTVRVWDTRTSKQVGQPLVGHAGAVYSVTCSPNDAHTCSGSADQLVLVCDAQMRQPLGQSLLGHSKMVCSRAHSHSARIGSGSADGTFRILDFQTSQDSIQPLSLFAGTTHMLNDTDHQASSQYPTERQTNRVTLSCGNIQVLPHSPVSVPLCPACGGSNVAALHTVATVSAPMSGKLYLQLSVNNNASPFPEDRLSSSHSSLICRSPGVDAILGCSWKLDQEGWITLCSSRHLVWLPPKVRGQIWHPAGTILHRAEHLLLADLSTPVVGKDWQKRFDQAAPYPHALPAL